MTLDESGSLKRVVQIAAITGITPTSSSLSSPAVSLDHLILSYDKRASVMISPKYKDPFLDDLEALRGSSG